MKKIFIIIIMSLICLLARAENIDASEIIKKIDNNRISETQYAKMRMIVHSRNSSRTLELITYSRGEDSSYSEYIAPAREKGTKMLKLDDNLWIYSPKTDRVIRISGHMLRQSVMGSDMSYEDLMTERELLDDYVAKVIDDVEYNSRKCWVLQLMAKSSDIAYAKRVIYVDKERFAVLKEELYGLSGTKLKETEIYEVMQVKDRWIPKHFSFKDVLKNGKGTEIFIDEIKFDLEVPESKFTKASLRK